MKKLLLIFAITSLYSADPGSFFMCGVGSMPSTLLQAVECRNPDNLRTFLQGSPDQLYAKLAYSGLDGETALIKAIRRGNEAIVTELLQAVATLNKQQQYELLSYAPPNGYTALVEAVDTLEYSEHKDDRIVRALVNLIQQLDPVQQRTVLTQRTQQGKTALDIARRKGYSVIVALLEATA